MGLMPRLREWRYVHMWRLRYWWMDTRQGQKAHIAAFCVAVIALVFQMVKLAFAAYMPPSPGEPLKSVYWWVVQLIIAVVAAAVAYALRPKMPEQAERKIDPPNVQDGSALKDYGGTVWIDWEDSALLAWKIVARDAIYAKGGK